MNRKWCFALLPCVCCLVLSGCLETSPPPKTQPAVPRLSLVISAETGYQPLTVSIQTLVTDQGNSSLIIQYGDGGTTSEPLSSHTYYYGTYAVVASLTLFNGTVLYQNKTIHVLNRPPNIQVQANQTAGEPPLQILFNANATDPDGSIVEYHWQINGSAINETNASLFHRFDIEGNYTIQAQATDNDGATSIANTTVRITSSIRDWSLTMHGLVSRVIHRREFEALVTAYGLGWSDGDNTWHGIPLWRLAAMIDDFDNETTSLNMSLVEKGYKIRLTAGDDFVVSFKAASIANDSGYLVTNTINGEPLPLRTPRDRPSWPLHLRGDKVHQPYNIGNITTLEFINIGKHSSQPNLLQRLLDLIATLRQRP